MDQLTRPISFEAAKAADPINPDRPDAASLQWLAKDFAALDGLDDRLASRVMRYLLDGGGAEVVAELVALKQAGPKLRLYCAQPVAAGEADARDRFFQSVQCSSPQFFARLGRVYEAASRGIRLHMARCLGGPELDWLQVLLIEASQLALHVWPPRCRPCAVLTAELIEAMLRAEGHPPDLLARAAFQPPWQADAMSGAGMETVLQSIPGLGRSAARHPFILLAALGQPDDEGRLRALHLMHACEAAPDAVVGKLFQLATGRRKKIRVASETLLARARPAAVAFLEDKAVHGRSKERAAAGRLLWRWEGERASAFLAARAAREPSKSVSRRLTALLAERPGRENLSCQVNRMIAALATSKAACRLVAAEQLARAGTRVAAVPLLTALKKEENEFAKNAMMTALRQLGVPDGKFLDRRALLEESARHVAEKTPEPLQWFPFHRLPPVHWAEDGGLVQPEIVRCWIVQGCKLKSPEPAFSLRHYAAALHPSERAILGQFVLETWIHHETSPVARATVATAARRVKNPALACKGVLSLAGACAADGAAPVVQCYVEQWHGRRVAQCRALLQMLSWVDHPSAAQLLRNIGGQFRTRTLQEEASRLANARAERTNLPPPLPAPQPAFS